MMARRPFSDRRAIVEAATQIWWTLTRSDWLEAFSAHPKIGDPDSLRAKFQDTATWAAHEQAGVATAHEETLEELARCNRRYEERFGYIFIVCASGKSANEMLDILRGRMANDPSSELRNAAAEQLKITQLRLEKLES